MAERGWYRDPLDPALERFWDGAAWTVATRPAGSGHARPSEPGPVRPAGSSGPVRPGPGPATRPSWWVPEPWPVTAVPPPSGPPVSRQLDRPPPARSVDEHPGPVVAFPPPPPPPPLGYQDGATRCSRTRRATAGLLDRIVIVGPLAVGWLLSLSTDPAGGTTPGSTAAAVVTLLSAVWAVVAGFVDLVVVQGVTGQSLGKRLLRIRLVGDRDSRPLGFGGALVRWLVASGLAVATCGVGGLLDHLWPLWSRDGKRIVDKWRSTSVVDAPPLPRPAPSPQPAGPTLP